MLCIVIFVIGMWMLLHVANVVEGWTLFLICYRVVNPLEPRCYIERCVDIV